MENRGLLRPVEEILDQRRRLIQGQQQEVTEEIIQPLSRLPRKEQQIIGESLQRINDFFKETPTSLSRKAREALARWGNAARKQGILDDEAFFKNVGQYFPFLYKSKEFQKLSSRYGVKPLRLSDLGYAKKRLSDVEMGGWSLWQEIKGSKYGKKQAEQFAQKLGEEAKKQIAGEFKRLTGHNLPSYSADNLFKANKLLSEASKYTEEQLASLGKQVREQMGLIGEATYPLAKRLYQLIHDVYTAQAFNKIAEIKGVLGREGMKGYIKLPESKRLGKLSGKWVEENLAREIEEIVKTGENPISKLLVDLNSIWKSLKVPYNPATVMRNIYSNLVLLWMGDVPVYNPRVVVPGALEYLKKGKIYRLLRGRGLYGGTYTAQELNALRRSLETAENPTKGILEWAVNTFHTPGRIYGAVEDVFKTIAAKHALSKGASPEQAINFANKWLFDYGKTSRVVEAGRRSFFPFFTFQAKILPRAIEFAVRKPEKLLLFLGAIGAYNNFSRLQLGITEEEEEAQKPAWLKERGTTTILLPERDQYGQLQFLDLSYIIPWGAWLQAKEGVPQALMPGGIATILYNAYAGYDPYRGEEIEPEEKAKYIASGLMPSLVPGGYSFRKLESAIAQRPDYYGRVRPLETTLLDVLGGIKIQPGGIIETRRQIFDIEDQMQKLKNSLSVIEKHPGISPEEKEKQRQTILNRLKELDTKRQQLATAVGKLPSQLRPREVVLSTLRQKPEGAKAPEVEEEVEGLIYKGKDRWRRAREIVAAEYYSQEEKEELLKQIGVDSYDEAEVDYFASQGGIELRAEYIKAKLEQIGDDEERKKKFLELAKKPRPNGKKLLTSTVAALLEKEGILVDGLGGKKKKKAKFKAPTIKELPTPKIRIKPVSYKGFLPDITTKMPATQPLTAKQSFVRITPRRNWLGKIRLMLFS